MFYFWKLNFVLFLRHFLVNISTESVQISTAIEKVVSMLFLQRRSNANEYMLIQLSFSTKYQYWNNIGSSILNSRNSFNVVSTFFVNVETTSINIRRLNFQLQPNFNVETTLVHRRWINVTLSTLLQRCFSNFETTSINVNRLNFHFQ